jgi:hypothetical protein
MDPPIGAHPLEKETSCRDARQGRIQAGLSASTRSVWPQAGPLAKVARLGCPVQRVTDAPMAPRAAFAGASVVMAVGV